jgi:hypothetical protein
VSTATATTEAGQGVVGEPVERVDPAFVWNLVVPGSAEAIGSLQWGIGVTEEAPYLAWSNRFRAEHRRQLPADPSTGRTTASTGRRPRMARSPNQRCRCGLYAQATRCSPRHRRTTAAIPAAAGDAVVDISTDQGASWEHQVLPIDLRGLAATDGVMSVGLSGGIRG